MRDAVVAFVELRDGDDRQFEIALRQCRGRPQFEQHPHQMPQRGRHMREHRDLIAERTVGAGEFAVDRGQLRAPARQARCYGHAPSSASLAFSRNSSAASGWPSFIAAPDSQLGSKPLPHGRERQAWTVPGDLYIALVMFCLPRSVRFLMAVAALAAGDADAGHRPAIPDVQRGSSDGRRRHCRVAANASKRQRRDRRRAGDLAQVTALRRRALRIALAASATSRRRRRKPSPRWRGLISIAAAGSMPSRC